MKKIISLSVVASSLLFAGTINIPANTWKLIGVNSEISFTDIKTQLGSSHIIGILGQDNKYLATWESNPTMKSLFNDKFLKFEYNKGYYIKTDINTSVTYPDSDSLRPNSVSIPANTWKLVGINHEMTFSDLATKLGGKSNIIGILGQDNKYLATWESNPTMKSLFNDKFLKIESGKSYYIKTATATTLDYAQGDPDPSATLAYDENGNNLSTIAQIDGLTIGVYQPSNGTIIDPIPTLLDFVIVTGTLNDNPYTLLVNGAFKDKQVYIKVMQGANVLSVSPLTTLSSISGTYMTTYNTTVTPTSTSTTDTSESNTTTIGATTYYQSLNAYGMNSSYELNNVLIKVFANQNLTTPTGTSNTIVMGSVNGVSTGANLQIDSSYAVGTKFIVKAYDKTSGSLLTESAPITYAGSGTPINFGQLYATVTTTADTTPPATPTVSAATANSVYVTAEAGSTIKVYNGATVIATSTGTGASRAIYFPILSASATLSVTATDAAGNISNAATTYAHVATTTTANAAPTMAVRSKSYTFEAGQNVEIDFKSQLGVTDPNGDYLRFSTNLPFFGMSMSIEGEYEGAPIAGTYTGKVKACDTFNACVESDNITIQVNQPQSNTGTDNGYIELPIVYGTDTTIPNLANPVTLYQPNGGDGYEIIAINTPSNGSITVTPYQYNGTTFTAEDSQVATYTVDTAGHIVVNMGATGGTGIFNILKATNIAMYGQNGIEYMTSWTQTSYGTEDDYKVQTEWSSYLSQVSINSIESFRNIMMATTSGGAWLWTQNGSRVLGSDGKVYPVQIIFNTDGSQQKGTVGATPIAGSSWSLTNSILTVSSDGTTQKYKFEIPTGSTTPVLMASYQDALNVPYTMAAYSTANMAEMIVKEMYNQKNSSSTGGYIPAEDDLATLSESNIANKQLTIDLNGNTAMVTFLSGSTQTYTITSPTYNEVGSWSISNGKIVFSRPGAENYYIAIATDMIHGYTQVGSIKTPLTIYSMTDVSQSVTNTAPYFIGSYAPISTYQGVAYSKNISELFYDDGGATNLTYTVYGLPTGISYNSSTKVISGTPSVTGVYNAQIQACDTQNFCGYGMINFDIFASSSTVDMPPQTPDVEIAPPALPTL